MDDFEFEPPSFSLGLDFDLDSKPQPPSRPDPLSEPAKRPLATSSIRTIDKDDDDFESPAWISVPKPADLPRPLKRLRRGPPSPLITVEKNVDFQSNADDDIEDFSSDENCIRGKLSTQSICSSSRSSLHAQKILTSASRNQGNSRKTTGISKASNSTNKETSSTNFKFPESTISPLRRFQLVDSDSDDVPVSEHSSKEAPCTYSLPKENQASSSKSSLVKELVTEKPAVDKYQNEDLWKDFLPQKTSHIPTPAFDEVFEEYFTSAKNKTETDYKPKDFSNNTEESPPAHHYFLHKDKRIQNLVRDRLPNFSPLGAEENQGYYKQNTSVIDYMGQFGQQDISRQSDKKKSIQRSSTGTKKNGKSRVDNISLDSENWVNPKSGTGATQNAKKRRVQAASKSSAYWYTCSDGKRVYVNKDGQRSTGSHAFRDYKKETGGFRKKKTAAKKKSAPKRK